MGPGDKGSDAKRSGETQSEAQDVDPSRYFPIAQSIVERLGADAVVLLVKGGVWGNGCAPAITFDPCDTPEARKSNTRQIRTVVAALRMVCDRLDVDVRAAGVPLEPLE